MTTALQHLGTFIRVSVALFTLSGSLYAQGVGIGTNTPDPSAALDISSDSTGILIPRMTAAQRDAINGPVVGLMVFVTDDMRFYCYEGSSWEKVGGDGTIMVDADGDTKVQVEEGPDDDTIRFDMGGTEYFRMAKGRLEVLNTGGSLSIGRGAGASDDLISNNNVFIGDSTGTNTTAHGNTAVGRKAMIVNTTGFQNVAIGASAMYNNTTGYQNVAIGQSALFSNTTGIYNTASGYQALFSNTTGVYNTASGYQALYSNTSGVNNTATGYQALFSNTEADYNTASGYQALYSNTTGNYNTASGYNALRFNTTGDYNTASGYQALYSNTTGWYNVALGREALYDNTTGQHNTAVGNFALANNTEADKNTAIGRRAMELNTTGEYNTALGNDALNANVSGSRSVALGTEAGFNSLGDSSVYIGNKAGYFETAGERLYIENSDADSANALIYGEFDNDWLRINGRLTPTMGMTDADGDTRVEVEGTPDDDTIRFVMDSTEFFRMANGRLEVVNTGGSIFIGRGAGSSDLFAGNSNVFIGDSTGTHTLSGKYNTASGSSAMKSNTFGSNNTAIGRSALAANTTGPRNTALGNFSLHLNEGGQENVAVGMNAGFSSTGDNSIFIGHEAGYFETESNRLYIESSDADSANALIYGEFDNDWLRVNGRLTPTLGMTDADGDTRILVEQGVDDDTIRLVIDSTEFFRMANGRLEVVNTGGSVFIGQGAGAADNLSAGQNVFIGDSSGITNTAGYLNVAIGADAFYSNTVGFFNTAVGADALASSTSGDYNTAIGMNALQLSTTADFNTAVGYESLKSNTIGQYNTAMGYQALMSNSSGWHNTAFGRQSLQSNQIGQHNTAIGNLAMEENIGGSQNVGIGRRALRTNTSGNYNTAVGQDALYSNPTGSRNVALGTEAGYSSTGDSSIYIGNKAGYFETNSNRLYIENSDADSANALIYGEFDNDILALNASVGIGTATPTEKLHVYGGHARIDRGSATSGVQRRLEIGGALTGSSNPYARIDFSNYDDNSSAADYTGASIRSYNDSGADAGDLRFFTADTLNSLNPRMAITSDGDVGIGTATPTALLSVNGTANKPGGGGWAVFSDARLKNVTGTFSRGLNEINRLQPVFFQYKKDNALGLPSDKTYVGFVAQEVQKVIPEAIDDSGEYLSLEADAIYLAMLNSIKELKAENDALKKELNGSRTEVEILRAELTQKTTALDARLAQLEAMLGGVNSEWNRE